MSQYKVIIKEEAQEDLRKLLLHEPKTYKKAIKPPLPTPTTPMTQSATMLLGVVSVGSVASFSVIPLYNARVCSSCGTTVNGAGIP
jgi:hypothetical protein